MLLLTFVACGGGGSDSDSPATNTVGIETLDPELGSGSPALSTTASPEPEATGPVLARATAATNGAPSVPAEHSPEPPDIAQETTQDADATNPLPAGISIGTPRPDDPLDEREPPSDAPVDIPTPRSSSFDQDGDGFLTPPELIQALRTTYPSYVWPAGYRIDLNALIRVIEEEAEKHPVFYENGYEQNLLILPNLCAWSQALLEAIFSGGDEAIAQSIQQLRATLEAHPEKASLREIVGDAVDRAELGDPAPLQVQIDAMGCAVMTWEPQTVVSAMADAIRGGTAANEFAAVRRDVVLL